MIHPKPKIFIVDNEIEICSLLKDFFDFIGYESFYETDGQKALARLEDIEYDLMFVDLRLETISGIEILKRSQKARPLSEVIVVTGYGSEETILETLRHGASSYIQKPISFSEIQVQSEEALARRRFNLKTAAVRSRIPSEDVELIKHFDDIVQLDKLSDFLNLTIDINTIADSILNGIESLIPNYFYSFLFFDDINKEMVIHAGEPTGKKTVDLIKRETIQYFEKHANLRVGDSCRIKVLGSGGEDLKRGKNVAKLTSVFVPILIENTIRGTLGVSGGTIEKVDYIQDILRIVSRKISSILTNATVHRNTKLLAITDGLTGLLNRSAFHERLESEYQRFKRYGSFLSLIVADFDNLKEINDNYGHPVGDEVLKKIGDIFRETTRETDVLTRYGGDEFVIVLPQTNIKNAINMAERIRIKIQEHIFKVNDKTFNCTISLGVATAPGKNIHSSEELLESADRALYESKRNGRNMVSIARQD